MTKKTVVRKKDSLDRAIKFGLVSGLVLGAICVFICGTFAFLPSDNKYNSVQQQLNAAFFFGVCLLFGPLIGFVMGIVIKLARREPW